MKHRRRLLSTGCVIGMLAAYSLGSQATGAGATGPLVIPMTDLPGGGAGLQAEVAGHSGLFLFDTGGGVTLVTPQTASVAGCRPWGQVTGFRATGERMDLPRCDNVRLRIDGGTFSVPTASVLDVQRMMPPQMPLLSGVLALDAFAGRVITIRPMAHELVVETSASLQHRIVGATQVPIRVVRDAEGLALTLDGAAQTSAGLAWMELDTGNGGPILVDAHVAGLLGLAAANRETQAASFDLVGGVPVRGASRVSGLIMDGDIGEAVLGKWDLTFDLAGGRAWFRPADRQPSALR